MWAWIALVLLCLLALGLAYGWPAPAITSLTVGAVIGADRAHTRKKERR